MKKIFKSLKVLMKIHFAGIVSSEDFDYKRSMSSIKLLEEFGFAFSFQPYPSW